MRAALFLAGAPSPIGALETILSVSSASSSPTLISLVLFAPGEYHRE
jgi:hypothetical protein